MTVNIPELRERIANFDPHDPTQDRTFAVEAVTGLLDLIDALLAAPGEHRDALLLDPPMRWSTKSLEIARDTCDVLRWKLKAIVDNPPEGPPVPVGSLNGSDRSQGGVVSTVWTAKTPP